MENRKNHWEDIYKKKKIEEVSWYQAHPEISLRMVDAAELNRDASIIDVGGGVSRLAGCLIDRGYEKVTVLDISGEALKRAQKSLGDSSSKIKWIERDITKFKPAEKFAFWHDRAVFHFLTDPDDRALYLETMEKSLTLQGYVMIATFALDAPERCSGLLVQRYSHESLQKTLGAGYHVILSDQETHLTPSGNQQNFIYALFRKN